MAGIVLSACAVPGEPQKLDRGVAYEIDTVREADAFAVTLQSLSDEPICLPAEQWPQPGGWLAQGATDTASLRSPEGPVASTETRFILCDPCHLEVAPAERLTGRINLDVFDVPDETDLADLTLDFEPTVYRCRVFAED